MIEAPLNKETKMRNVEIIETLNAKYIIYYSHHKLEVDPRIVKKIDAAIIEDITDFTKMSIKDEVLTIMEEGRDPYHALVQAIIKKEVPIFFVDLSPETFSKINDALEKQIIIPVLEALIAAIIYDKQKRKNGENKQGMTRREFLKKALSLSAAAYLSSPLLEIFFSILNPPIKEVDESSITRKFEKYLAKLNSLIHPELRGVVEIRNELIAQKAETLAKSMRNKLQRKPVIAIVIGARHFQIKDALKLDENERLKRLRKSLGEHFAEEGFIARVDFLAGQGDLERRMKVTIFKDPAFTSKNNHKMSLK